MISGRPWTDGATPDRYKTERLVRNVRKKQILATYVWTQRAPAIAGEIGARRPRAPRPRGDVYRTAVPVV